MSVPLWRQVGAGADGSRIRVLQSACICSRSILSIATMLKSTVELKFLPSAPQKDRENVNKKRLQSTRLCKTHLFQVFLENLAGSCT